MINFPVKKKFGLYILHVYGLGKHAPASAPFSSRERADPRAKRQVGNGGQRTIRRWLPAVGSWNVRLARCEQHNTVYRVPIACVLETSVSDTVGQDIVALSLLWDHHGAEDLPRNSITRYRNADRCRLALRSLLTESWREPHVCTTSVVSCHLACVARESEKARERERASERYVVRGADLRSASRRRRRKRTRRGKKESLWSRSS